MYRERRTQSRNRFGPFEAQLRPIGSLLIFIVGMLFSVAAVVIVAEFTPFFENEDDRVAGFLFLGFIALWSAFFARRPTWVTVGPSGLVISHVTGRRRFRRLRAALEDVLEFERKGWFGQQTLYGVTLRGDDQPVIVYGSNRAEIEALAEAISSNLDSSSG